MASAHRAIQEMGAYVEQLEAEVARLREERDEACDALQQRDFQISEYAGRLANERAVVVPLRALLDEACDLIYDTQRRAFVEKWLAMKEAPK